jgi:hypothetical protein
MVTRTGLRAGIWPFTRTNRLAHTLALVQGIYFLATGIWPLVSIDTFQAVTGEKHDLWLVHTVGVLVAAIGLVLLVSGWRRTVSPELALLAVGSALALAGIDVLYVARGVIDRIYLLDAVVEAVLILLWVAAWPTRNPWRLIR